MNKLSATALLAGCAALAAIGQAEAGGFNRGVANLDGLYGATQLGLYAGVTYVSPQRSYDTINMILPAPGPSLVGVTQTDVQFANSYVVPYASVGGRIGGD